MDRREALAATVGGLGAWLLSYIGSSFGWYWDYVLTPEPNFFRLLIHQGNIPYSNKVVNPKYYGILSLDPETGDWWMEVNGKKTLHRKGWSRKIAK